MAAVRWASVPGEALPGAADGRKGQWAPDRNEITVVASDTAYGPLIRHEMLHALLGARATGHPAAYFGARCDGYVVCAFDCAAEVAAATPAPPVAAPALRPDALVVTARLVTPASGGSEATEARVSDGTFGVIITALNPTGVAGWVPRGADPTASETPDFGVSLDGRPPAPDIRPFAPVRYAPGARTFFAAGGTRRYVWDVDARPFYPGPYQLRGSFAGASSAPTPVTLTP